MACIHVLPRIMLQVEGTFNTQNSTCLVMVPALTGRIILPTGHSSIELKPTRGDVAGAKSLCSSFSCLKVS